METVIKTKTVAFGENGKAEARITVTYYKKDNNFEGYITGEKIEKFASIEIIANGKVISKTTNDYIKLYEENDFRSDKLPQNVVLSFAGGLYAGGRGTYDRIAEALAELKAEAQAEIGGKSNDEVKVEKEEAAKIEAAKEIVEIAEEIGIESLITDAKLKQKQEVYNQVQNEGSKSDGNYVPTEVTLERYLQAKKTLEIHKEG